MIRKRKQKRQNQAGKAIMLVNKRFLRDGEARFPDGLCIYMYTVSVYIYIYICYAYAVYNT